MEKKLLIIHKLSFGEPAFFPQLEQLIKHRAFEHLCLQHTLSISALGGGRTEDYEDRAFWVAQGGKTIPKGEKASSLRFVLSVTEVTAYFSFFLKKKKSIR